MSTMRLPTFGIKTSQMGLAYQEIADVWRQAEAIPLIEHAWLWDHLVPLRGDVQAPALEAWTLLGALAARTSRLRLGVIVTSNRLRSPTLLAKMAATVDVIAEGRLVFGIGAGGSRVQGDNPAVREFEAYGYPLVSPAQAVRDLAESCAVIRRMWTEPDPFDYTGQSLHLRGAICSPQPVQKPHPPIMIGGSGERTLRVVAEHASIWNYPGEPSEDYTRRSRLLDSYCTDLGRNPGEITRSMQTIVRCDEPGAPSRAEDLIVRMVEAGITHIVLGAVLGGRPVRWLAEEIIMPALSRLNLDHASANQ